MQMDDQLAFFSHVVSNDFAILVALLNKKKNGEDKKESNLLTSRNYKCYAPDHHQYAEEIALECVRQSGFANYEEMLKHIAKILNVTGETIEEIEHNIIFAIMALPTQNYTQEDFIRLAIELRLDPTEYSFLGIKNALLEKFKENEMLPFYQIAMLINAMVLRYFEENPCQDSVLYSSSLTELRSVEKFANFNLFKQSNFAEFSEKEIFCTALVLAIIALHKKDIVFYGRSGDSKAELIRKLKRFTVLLNTVPQFAKSSNIDVIQAIYAFSVVYLGRYQMPMPREMACEMLFATQFEKFSDQEQNALVKAEKTTESLESLTKKLLANGVTKDQMQNLIGVLALSKNKLIKIENIFIEWSVKLGLR